MIRRDGKRGAAKMKRVARLGVVLGLMALAACAELRPRAPDVSQIKPLETTYDQVIATFGLPTSEVMLSGGSRLVLYSAPEYEPNGFQMTPFVNLFRNNYDLIVYDYFMFNRDGVLQSFSIPHFSARAGVANPGA